MNKKIMIFILTVILLQTFIAIAVYLNPHRDDIDDKIDQFMPKETSYNNILSLINSRLQSGSYEAKRSTYNNVKNLINARKQEYTQLTAQYPTLYVTIIVKTELNNKVTTEESFCELTGTEITCYTQPLSFQANSYDSIYVEMPKEAEGWIFNSIRLENKNLPGPIPGSHLEIAISCKDININPTSTQKGRCEVYEDAPGTTGGYYLPDGTFSVKVNVRKQ